MTKTQSRDDIVLTIVETPFKKQMTPLEKQMEAVRQRNIEADTICRERLRRWEKEDAAWQLLAEVKAALPNPTGGLPWKLIDLGESVAPGARFWPEP